MSAPAWCPNLGVDCGFPDCVYLEAECATAEASVKGGDADEPHGTTSQAGAYVATGGSHPVKQHATPPLFPITADEIFKS